MSEPEDSEQARLAALSARIAEARRDAKPEPEAAGPSEADGSALKLGMRVGTELVAALVVGIMVGVFLDRWLKTAPAMTILFFFVGIAAGMLNVYRAMTGVGLAVGYKRPKVTGEAQGTMAGTDKLGNERD